MRILVVSGGAETVGASIVEWAHRRGHRVLVFALGRRSLLAGLPGVEKMASAQDIDDRAEVLEHLCAYIEDVTACEPGGIHAFATEDDSLGLLLDAHRRLQDKVHISCCRHLVYGGLDKAELFEVLERKGLSKWLAPTRSLRSPEDVAAVLTEWPGEVVFKPAFKPWSRNLEGGRKLYTREELDSPAVRREMESSWRQGRAWVAQPRLAPLVGYERSACVVRGDGFLCAEVVEFAKYPSSGGSACWVRTQPHSRLLLEAAEAIASALDLVGLAEMSFLAGPDGGPRLLELNARPWLQVELLLHAGFDILDASMHATTSGRVPEGGAVLREADWISVERLLAKLAKGDGRRLETLKMLVSAWRARPFRSVWSSGMRGVRMRWALRVLAKALRVS